MQSISRFAAQNEAEHREVDRYPLYALVAGIERRGNEYQALCPFHTDKELGSFTIYNRGSGWRYKCFSCGAGEGNAADFLMKRDNLSYPAALAALGIRASNKPPLAALAPTPALPTPTRNKELLPPIARDVWRTAFHTLFEDNRIRDELMRQRGFTDLMTVVRFQFGYLRHAPQHEGAGAGDAWVIPIWRPDGDPQYCQTRNRTPDVAHNRRYRPLMTYEQARRYTQPKQLFWAADSDMGGDAVYIVEGEFKAAAMWDLGKPTVGVPGVGSVNLLREASQAGLFDRYSTIRVMFDNDEAGRAAAGKVAAVMGREVEVLSWVL